MTMKELFAPSDMTVGKPWEKIVAFTIPMLIGNIAQQLYNTVDSIVIGKYVGDNALAAVGSASPILNLLLVLFVGISVGAGVMVSQYFGARQRKELSMTIGNCVTLTAISSIIIMILGAVLSRPLLEMLKTPDSIIDWCTSYLVILMVGCAGSVTRMHDGRMHPKVAASAPGMPAILLPTKVAELTAIGPGVIWERVMRSVNSDIESQPYPCTTCPWISGIAA